MTVPVAPPLRSALFRRARVSASIGLLRTAAALTRASARVGHVASSFALHAVDRADRGAVTASIYGGHRADGREGLFGWEAAWLTRDLPPAPARVLLGGAGRGQEARWLLERGYSVVAFDPARESVARHEQACPEVPCFVLDYEGLARAHHARRAGTSADASAARVLEAAPYDAALLGWGSLTHVLEERDQEALFEALAALVPRGPILASFFMSVAPAHRGRAARLGAWLGSALGSAEVHGGGDEHVRCLTHAGFAYSFSPVRLQRLAACAARTLELHAGAGYPHATFR